MAMESRRARGAKLPRLLAVPRHTVTRQNPAQTLPQHPQTQALRAAATGHTTARVRANPANAPAEAPAPTGGHRATPPASTAQAQHVSCQATTHPLAHRANHRRTFPLPSGVWRQVLARRRTQRYTYVPQHHYHPTAVRFQKQSTPRPRCSYATTRLPPLQEYPLPMVCPPPLPSQAFGYQSAARPPNHLLHPRAQSPGHRPNPQAARALSLRSTLVLRRASLTEQSELKCACDARLQASQMQHLTTPKQSPPPRRNLKSAEQHDNCPVPARVAPFARRKCQRTV